MGAERTDLALETRVGADSRIQQLEEGIERTVVRIDDPRTAQELNRPQGTYVTLSFPQQMTIELRMRAALSEALARELRRMLPAQAHTVLVTGLGNRAVTPDALGPRTIERVLVTRHMQGCMPQEVEARMKRVCAAAPGVLGVTGLETAEVLRGMVEHAKPDAVIAVDALAARSSRRICSTIQVADTGVTPGSGVGNHRKALTLQTLGVPVIAVGIPMVVYALTIVQDALDAFTDGDSDEARTGMTECVQRHVSQQLGDLIVTPREVDALVERMAGIVADGINMALHPQLSEGEIAQLTAQ